MNARQVALGVLLGLGGVALALAAGAGLLAGDPAGLPVLVLGVGLALFGALVAWAGARASSPRAAHGRGGGALGTIPGPVGDIGADYRNRDYGDTGDSGGGSSGGDSGGGWFSGGGDSGGGWSSGGGGDSGGGGGSW
ncbi:hypothetical protein ACTMS0_06625 [Micromonospora sp. H33]|uniref:hypothetical protein n=1 Tax=Micromonospora sp. H33 TaxID=3452215 RepID=UPI003F8C91CC